jgi:TM2 domain-containing membrane protein YozV
MSDAPPPPGWNPEQQAPSGWNPEPQPPPPPPQWGPQTAYPPAPVVSDPRKSKLAAGLIAILVPGWGIHNFYLGFTGKGIAQLVLTLTCVGMIVSIPWSIVEGILILVGSIKADASGLPLKD